MLVIISGRMALCILHECLFYKTQIELFSTIEMHFAKETDSTQQEVAMAVNSNYLDKIHSRPWFSMPFQLYKPICF